MRPEEIKRIKEHIEGIRCREEEARDSENTAKIKADLLQSERIKLQNTLKELNSLGLIKKLEN